MFFLHPGVLHSRVLTIRGLKFGGSHHQGFLQSGGSYNQGSYIQEFISVSHMTGLCIDVDRCSLHSGVQISVSYMTGLCQDVDIDRNILRSGSVFGGSHHQGFLQSGGSYNQGSYIQEFISVSHMTGLCIDVDRCSLHSGVQISVSYMTGLCQDVDIDRNILRSGSVLIVNFYIQCVSCAQILIMT